MDYVILVEPEGPANIGFIARVMKNFGFSKLVLVNPRCELGLEARKYAMHAWDIVENAIILDDYTQVFDLEADIFVGTTAKPSESSTRASLTIKEFSQQLAKVGRPSLGLIFGRESSGLTNSELRKCDIVVHIPTSDEYKAMNLSHAVSVVLYEIYSLSLPEAQGEFDRREVEKLLRTFEELASLDEIGLRNPENSVKMFRNVIARALIKGREAKGIIVVLDRALQIIKNR